jgi:aspartate/methionine/tyrosine aminotransferase
MFFGLQVEFVKKLILEAGVVAVPGQGFFHTNLSSDEVSSVSCNYQKRYIRFAFCKSDATLSAVSEKLGKLLDAEGHLALH